MSELRGVIERDLRGEVVEGRAAKEKQYLKSRLAHWGVPMPAIRAAARRVHKSHPDLGHDALVSLVEELWDLRVHELRAVGVELLRFYDEILVPSDLALVERLLREAKTWALVDPLAISVVGDLVVRFEGCARQLDRWAADDDFWVRRSALLALLVPLREGGGDFERFSRYADAMLEEKEFFIRKAIGWVLRETSKQRPDLVFRWLEPRLGRASGLTIREASRYLDEQQQAAIRGA